jgi:hypothetical protein
METIMAKHLLAILLHLLMESILSKELPMMLLLFTSQALMVQFNPVQIL